MKVNKECIKDVLNYVMSKTGVSVEKTKAILKSTDIFSIIEDLGNTYTNEEIVHSVIYAGKCGYLDMTSLHGKRDFLFATVDINDVTPLGYKFLETE